MLGFSCLCIAPGWLSNAIDGRLLAVFQDGMFSANTKFDGNKRKNRWMRAGLVFIKKMANKPILVYHLNSHVPVPRASFAIARWPADVNVLIANVLCWLTTTLTLYHRWIVV